MRRNIALDLLRTLACLLILNFHLEPIFPNDLKILSIGGDIGNNLFFMLSGYLLYRRINNTDLSEFKTFLFLRIKNILPQVIVILVASIIVGSVRISSIKDILLFFFFPAHFWFVIFLIYFYIMIFYQTKLFNKNQNIVVCVFLILLHIIFNGVYSERFVIGYLSMLCGYYMNEYTKNHSSVIKIIVAGLIYVVFKLLNKIAFPSNRIIHLLIGFSIITFCFLLIDYFADNDDVKKTIEKNFILKKVISIVSSCSLEVYLLSFFNEWHIITKVGELLPFPLSYFASIIIIVMLSYLMHKVFIIK